MKGLFFGGGGAVINSMIEECDLREYRGRFCCTASAVSIAFYCVCCGLIQPKYATHDFPVLEVAHSDKPFEAYQPNMQSL